MKLITTTSTYKVEFTYADVPYMGYVCHSINYGWWEGSNTDFIVRDMEGEEINYPHPEYEHIRDSLVELWNSFRNPPALTYTAQQVCDVIYAHLKNFYYNGKTFELKWFTPDKEYFTIEERSDWDLECNIYNDYPVTDDDFDWMLVGWWVIEVFTDNVVPDLKQIWDQATFIASKENCGFDVSEVESPLDILNLESQLWK